MKPDPLPDAGESCPVPTSQSDGRIGDDGELDWDDWKLASWISSSVRRRFRGAGARSIGWLVGESVARKLYGCANVACLKFLETWLKHGEPQ